MGYRRQLLRPPSWTLWSRRHRYHSPRPLPLPEFTSAGREGLRGNEFFRPLAAFVLTYAKAYVIYGYGRTTRQAI